MNYEDSLEVCAKVFAPDYMVVGGKYFYMKDNGSIDYDDGENEARATIDENGDSLQPQELRYIDFGKCVIVPNTRASSVTLLDGLKYIYSYEVVVPLNKKRYKILPKEGDAVRIIKKDGTIDKIMEVKGFVTYKKRYLKLWL